MEISRRSPVPLREIWPLETDFSDWLVSDGGIAMIAEDIGVTIENPRRECRPGDFPCDIVAQLQGDEDHVVIIENQYGKTNHDHLGKLITYAATNDATTAIWISETLADDHRKAVDWLNEVTPINVNIYLARLHAYRIGNSPVSPALDVACRPNVGSKVRREINSVQSERHNWRKDFWTEILDYISQAKPPFRLPSPSTGEWSAIALGRSGFALYMVLADRGTKINCQIGINGPSRLGAFAQLEAQREEIESETGYKLEWCQLPDKKMSRIFARCDLDPQLAENLPAVQQWLAQYSIALFKAFAPRIQRLPRSVDISEDEDNSSQPLDTTFITS